MGTVESPPMMDLTRFLRRESAVPVVVEETTSTDLSPEQIFIPLAAVALSIGAVIAHNLGLTVDDFVRTGQGLLTDPKGTLQGLIEGIRELGPEGVVYFGLLYFLAECLAVPATPLTLSAGYLFGITEGVLVVLLAGVAASMVGFVIGKNFLRSWVEGVLEENPKLRKLDKAIGEQGFKLLCLVRLSPIFPFALSNYVYGASSINFSSFLWGTLIGFTPGTIGYVYTGMVGNEIMFGNGSQPWYVYGGGLVVLLGLLKLVTDVASGIVEAIDDDTASP